LCSELSLTGLDHNLFLPLLLFDSLNEVAHLNLGELTQV
jgi:hypothetical protein